MKSCAGWVIIFNYLYMPDLLYRETALLCSVLFCSVLFCDFSNWLRTSDNDKQSRAQHSTHYCECELALSALLHCPHLLYSTLLYPPDYPRDWLSNGDITNWHVTATSSRLAKAEGTRTEPVISAHIICEKEAAFNPIAH